jgi:hypothetical protein
VGGSILQNGKTRRTRQETKRGTFPFGKAGGVSTPVFTTRVTTFQREGERDASEILRKRAKETYLSHNVEKKKSKRKRVDADKFQQYF